MERKSFDRKSMKTRLVTTFIVTSIIPILLVNIISYYNTSELVRENVESMIRANLQQTKVALDVWLDSYTDILFQVYTDDYIVELVDKINAGEDIANNRKLLRKTLRGLFYTKDHVKSISIITDSGELIFYDQLTASTTNLSWMESIPYSQEELYRKISSDNKTHLLTTGEEVGVGSNSCYLFHIGHRIIDYRDVKKQCGIVMVSIDESLLKEICSSTTEGGVNFIVDGKGYIVSCFDEDRIGKPLYSEYATEKEKKSACKNMVKESGILGNGELSVYTIYDEETGWMVVRVTNQEELVLNLHKQQKLLVVVTVASLVIVLVLIISQIRGMTNSIKKVVKTMRIAGKGNLDAKVEPDKRRPTEIDIIAEEFNSTMDKLKVSTEKQKNAEIKALEAQINPHFLYNTLDTINWMAIDKDEYDISNNITALASILRYGITNSNGVVKIREEVEWLKQYIFLQQSRIKNTFECNINIEPELMEKPIHKLLLQPFIENAILHGFEGVNRKHILNVELCQKDNFIYIKIEDNGCGMPEDKVWEINNGIFGKAESKRHIGMENAITRIGMYYGESAKVEIESEIDKGTRVNIWIPLS